jgi:hypothetical protein
MVGIRITRYYIKKSGGSTSSVGYHFNDEPVLLSEHEQEDCINQSPFTVDLGDTKLKVEFFEHKEV